MKEHISYEGNPETRGTSPVYFFEDASGPMPPGVKARPRPADRPRELPPDDPASGECQPFEDEKSSQAGETQDPPQPDDSDQ